jgi:GNAT superfamily N-acetyltransferase
MSAAHPTGILSALADCVTREHPPGVRVTYRLMLPTDDITAITELLHRAYAPLAAAGMRFTASHQTVDTTGNRAAKGDTIVAVLRGRVIGVVTLATASATRGSDFLEQPDVASFGQFVVEPEHQRTGIGGTLLSFVEEIGRARGVGQLALDTAEPASNLIRYYESKGYRFVEHVRWPSVNYRSVVMAKSLQPAADSDR